MAPPGRRLFLVGFMGCGKSAVGREAAGAMGWAFEDIDARVEAAEGRSIEEMFARFGEERFREAEWRALQEVSDRPEVVVATGGGLFLALAARRLMRRSGVTVWIDAPLPLIRERLGGGRGRPLWSGRDPMALRALYERRRAAYALADRRVAAAAGDPPGIARRVVELAREVFR